MAKQRRQHIIAAIHRMAIRRWGTLGETVGPPRDWWDEYRPLGMPTARTVIARLGVRGWRQVLEEAGLEPPSRALSRAIPYHEDGLDPGQVDSLAEINPNPNRMEWPLRAIHRPARRRVWDINSHSYVWVDDPGVQVMELI